MKIGIDVSQTAFAGSGVGKFVEELVVNLSLIDKKNEYILFFSSLRNKLNPRIANLRSSNFKIKTYKFPLSFLDLLWNKLHFLPIELFIGNVDIFMSSDWLQPPTKNAKKTTIIYDLIVYKYPNETAKSIVEVQKRKLKWVKREVDIVLCISEATKKDVKEILGIGEEKLKVIYPGL